MSHQYHVHNSKNDYLSKKNLERAAKWENDQMNGSPKQISIDSKIDRFIKWINLDVVRRSELVAYYSDKGT